MFINNKLPEAAIVWYGQKGAYDHAAFSYKGHIFGFANGQQTRESRNLEHAIMKAQNGLAKSYTCLAIQEVRIADDQKAKLENLSQAKEFPCYTCMDAVSRILKETSSVRIPFFLGQLPNCSQFYLDKMQQTGKSPLGKRQVYSKNPVNENITITARLVEGICFTGFVMGTCGIIPRGMSMAVDRPMLNSALNAAAFIVPILVGLSIVGHLAYMTSAAIAASSERSVRSSEM